MAVSIRLQRFGAKKRPFYRIVAADKRFKRDGRFLELLGTYDPMRSDAPLTFKQERLDYWMSVGALPSDTVASLLRRAKRDAAAAATAATAEAS